MLLERSVQREDLPGYKCDACSACDTTTSGLHIKHTSKYLMIRAPRVTEERDRDGHRLRDENGNTVTKKTKTGIKLPREPLDLSALLPMADQTESTRYEVFGMVCHIGSE